jgi:type III pantothenate kinase
VGAKVTTSFKLQQTRTIFFLAYLCDMTMENSVLAIDAGNTSIKVGHFQKDHLIEVKRFLHSELDQFFSFIEHFINTPSILSSVVSNQLTAEIISRTNANLVNADTPKPVTIEYETQNTLGIDRLCNAVAIVSRLDSEFGVVIDIGTCIKFDLITKEGLYKGGSISPGIDLRYKALNDYTGKLPKLSNKSNTNLVGGTTASSIQSGVINGINAEINGLMDMYSMQFESLTFFMTGGDASCFDILSKNDIFADENLTLIGLFEIYKYNA